MKYSSLIAAELDAVAHDSVQRFQSMGLKGVLSEVDLEFGVFEQLWGSTALGFGGIGGSAMTSARTTVVFAPHRQGALVYFAGRFAYLLTADQVNSEKVRQAYVERRMPAVYDLHKII